MLRKFLTLKSNEEISRVLFEKAIQFLDHGLCHIKVVNEEPIADEHAILSVAHSIELVVKATIALEDRNLILEKKSNHRTVGIKDSFKLLETNCGISLSEEEKQSALRIREIRNEIEHFTAYSDVRDVNSVIGYVVSFWCAFVNRHFQVDWRNMLSEEQLDKVLQIDAKHQKLLETAIESAEAEYCGLHILSVRVAKEECENCFQETVVVDLDRERGLCHYCHFEFHVSYCEVCGDVIVDHFASHHNICASCHYKVEYEK